MDLSWPEDATAAELSLQKACSTAVPGFPGIAKGSSNSKPSTAASDKKQASVKGFCAASYHVQV